MSPRALKGAFINYERGLGGRRMGDLRGGGDLNSFYTEKGRGGDLKCFQNTGVRT